MNNGADKWLTLAEVVRQANLSEIEVRRLVGQYGNFLAPRKFGDIVKYPPNVAQAIDQISSLYRLGWRTDEILEVLKSIDLEEVGALGDQFQQEMGDSMALQDERFHMIRSSLELLQKLISNIGTLTTKLAAAMAEIKNLREENQALRTRLSPYQTLQG